MSELRDCPLCHRPHEVDNNGTISTWLVNWTGDEVATVSTRYLSDEKQRRLAELRTKYARTPEIKLEETEGYIPHQTSSFIHYGDALGEYNFIKRLLVERGDWDRQEQHLTITEGERESWHDLFESPGKGVWMA